MALFSNDRDYDISVVTVDDNRAGTVRYHCNAIPPIGGSIMLGGKVRKVLDVVVDYDTVNRQTQHQGTKVPVTIIVE